MWCGTRISTVAAQDTRRVATMVFADVAGSTRAAEHLEPEVVRRILGSFYATAREILGRYDGTVEKFIGDAVVAVFGVPVARADDAARAVRAAWDLREAGLRMHRQAADAYGVDVRLRVGVNTGDVVAGDVTTGSSFVSGDAVNVAARLEQAAVPGEVLLGRLTANLAGRSLQLGEPVELSVKGRQEPVWAAPLLGWDAAAEQTPFLGRTELLALLTSLPAQPTDRRLRLSGPPGIGRSRLLSEVAATISATVVLLSLAGKDVPRVRREVAEQLPLGAAAPTQLLDGLRALRDGSATAVEADWVVTTLLREAHRRQRVVLLLDDEQSADAGVAAWVEALAAALGNDLGALVTAWRTGDRDVPEDGVRQHTITPLDDTESRALLEGLGRDKADHGRLDEVLALAHGNPLFLVEAGRLVSQESVPVPVGLRALLQARLDQLDEAARDVLVATAVLGTEADVASVRALSEEVDTTRLVDEGVLELAEGRMRFRQTSMRDAVLSSLTVERTARLHSAAGSVLAAREADPEAIGRHLGTAAHLRARLRLDPTETEALATQAVRHLLAAAAQATRAADRHRASKVVDEALALSALVPHDPHLRGELALWANRFGHFAATVGLVPDDAPLPALKERGLALVRAPEPDSVARGREILALAGDLGDADALASLAGSLRISDPERAYRLYLAALELAPSDPYPLGNVLEHEILASGDLTPVAARRTELLAAHVARRAQAERGEDLPWSWYDASRFALYLELSGEAYTCCAAAVLTSTATWMVSTSRRSLAVASVADGHAEWQACRELLELASTDAAPTPALPRVVVLAGASATQDDAWVRAHADVIAAGLPEAGVLVSGGTAQGVSALAADLSDRLPDWTSRGYLPGQLPDEVLPDRRYDELRRSEGTGFTIREALLAWRDLLDAGHDPADVRVLCLGGGEISAQEVQTALALGARVAVLRPPDGPLDPPGLDGVPWSTALRLQVLDGDQARLAAFLA